MSTATITPARIPQTIDAALIARAQAIYDNAMGPGFRWSQESSEVTDALDELASAIGFYRRIADGHLAPEIAYGMCSSLPQEHWLTVALRLAAEEAVLEAEEVTKVIAEVLGDRIAAEVRGEDKGES